MNRNKQLWLDTGYQTFAREGPTGLKIEALARSVQKNKSSFYYLFGDLENFQEALLDYHLSRADEIAAQASRCIQLDPEVMLLLVEVRQDIFFNRQLRIHRTIPHFQACFTKANQKVEASFFDNWKIALGLIHNPQVARVLLDLIVENFYLRVTEESLSYDWLKTFFKEIQTMVLQLNQANLPK